MSASKSPQRDRGNSAKSTPFKQSSATAGSGSGISIENKSNAAYSNTPLHLKTLDVLGKTRSFMRLSNDDLMKYCELAKSRCAFCSMIRSSCPFHIDADAADDAADDA